MNKSYKNTQFKDEEGKKINRGKTYFYKNDLYEGSQNKGRKVFLASTRFAIFAKLISVVIDGRVTVGVFE